MTWVPYVVAAGDHLAGLAFRFGTDPDALWNAPENADLAKKRPNREMLVAGDVLYVPDDAPPALALSVGSTNAYTAEVPKTHVAIHVAAGAVDRVKGKRFEVHGMGGKEALTGTVGDDGAVEFDVPVNVRCVDLVIPDAGIRTAVFVGDLDPIEERSGVTQRLRNLGLLHQPDEVDDELLAHALRVFQARQGLEPDGTLTPETVDALRDAHGG